MSFGSPSLEPLAPPERVSVPGFGAPSYFDGLPFALRGGGFGDPHGGHTTLSRAGSDLPAASIALTVSPHTYGNDGGAYVTLRASAPLPTRGPYQVRLRDVRGALWPPATYPGCYSAVAGQADRCTTDRAMESLAFTLPKLPQGAYALSITWDAGLNALTTEPLILIVPADVCLDSGILQRGFA